MVDALHRALSALAEAHPHLDAWELADAVWLAASAGDDLADAAHRGAARTHRGRQEAAGRSGPWGPDDQDGLTAGTVHERLATSTTMAPGREVTVAPARSPAGSLAMGRAFQPFTKPWPHGAGSRLDVDLTVDAYAESGILVPVMKSEPERWFDLVVITDRTPSMMVWQADIRSLISLLNGTGIFRRAWRWQLDPTAATITDGRGEPVAVPARTADVRRLVILISDFAAPAWDGTPPWQLVHALAADAPTVLVDPLPPHLWAHSGLDHPTAPVHAKAPGVSSGSLKFRLPLWLHTIAPEADWLPVPVAGFDATDIGRWARTLMRADPEGTDAVLLNLDLLRTLPDDVRDEPSLPDTVDAFLHTASPEAARLAILCSPIERFSLALLHLIRHTCVPSATLSDLAELLVSGLIDTDNAGQEHPVLSFRAGVAARLRTHLTYHDAWLTFDAISRYMATTPADAQDRDAMTVAASVIDPTSKTLVPVETSAFAEAATDLERVLVHADIAHQIAVEPPEAPQLDLPSSLDTAIDTFMRADRYDDEHMTICAVDITGFGGAGRTRSNYVALQEGMYQAVERAFTQSGISWADCYQEGTGDGILTLAPATFGKSVFAEKLPRALVAALRDHNAVHPPEERLRLRMALHAGEIARDARGVTGPALIHAFRLIESPPVKEALLNSTGALVIVASEWFYNEVVRHRAESAPEDYERIEVSVKETQASGWIRLPDAHSTEAALTAVSSPDYATVSLPLRPASPRFYQVVDALETIPCMQGEHTRALVIEQLPFARLIRFFPNRRAHVTSILRTCLDFEDGLVQLVTTISNQEPSGSLPVNRLVSLLTDKVLEE